MLSSRNISGAEVTHRQTPATIGLTERLALHKNKKQVLTDLHLTGEADNAAREAILETTCETPASELFFFLQNQEIVNDSNHDRQNHNDHLLDLATTFQ